MAKQTAPRPLSRRRVVPALPPAQIAPAPGTLITEDDITLALRYYRLRERLTLRELAAEVDISKSSLQRAELGQGDFTVQELGRLADALQVSPWTLVQFAAWPVPCCPCRAPHTGWGRA